MAVAIVVLLLGLVGLVNSLYLTLVSYEVVKKKPSSTPGLCTPEEESCDEVSTKPESLVLGIPNSVFGMAYYVIISTAAIVRLVTGTWQLMPLLTLVAVGAVIFSLYLAWMLIFRLRVFCRLCFLAHAINITLAAIFLLIVF